MQQAQTTLPGVRFEVRAPAREVTPLRTDIAGFAGPTRRGPAAEIVRVEGWRDYLDIFGGLTEHADTPYAVRGYFENGGQVAYIVRTLGQPSGAASGLWTVGEVDLITNEWTSDSPAGGGFEAVAYEITAASPGNWANGTRVLFEYRLRGDDGNPELTIEVHPPQEPPEYLVGLPLAGLADAVAQRSRLIRLQPQAAAPAAGPHDGPRTVQWAPVILDNGVQSEPSHSHYLQAVEALIQQPEVALMAAPDLYAMQATSNQIDHVLATMIAGAEQSHDRQVLAAVPALITDPQQVLQWIAERRLGLDPQFARTLAVYHPWLRVPDPLGGVIAPLRSIAPVGHVAGVISRLDRERGAHHTPANASLYEAVDLARAYNPDDQGAMAAAGVNQLRCSTGHGLIVWGGRTAYDPRLGTSGLFIAHRRLIHRLIRAIHRVAAPLVFDNNGPALWLTLVRAITTVLVEAWRAGALKGERPEQAFLVRCDETTTPPEIEELGQVHCEVYLAPAIPMEFITLRIAVSREGRLEVIEP